MKDNLKASILNTIVFIGVLNVPFIVLTAINLFHIASVQLTSHLEQPNELLSGGLVSVFRINSAITILLIPLSLYCAFR